MQVQAEVICQNLALEDILQQFPIEGTEQDRVVRNIVILSVCAEIPHEQAHGIARALDTPDFFAYPVRPGITFTYLGTRVNRQSRMVMKDGKPSANMFAAGEIMAGNVLGQGYTAGVGMTIGTAFGRIAGQEAARAALA